MGDQDGIKEHENFADRLLKAIEEKKNPCCVGLDPRIGNIPEHIRKDVTKLYMDSAAVADAFVRFNKEIINAVYDIVPAVKPQRAFYEQYGPAGVDAFHKTVEHAKSNGLIVIEDAKRNDIGSTAKAYADGHLGEVEACDGSMFRVLDVDAMTVNAYLGIDGVRPFMDACKKYGKGIFILDKTSNPSAGDLQDRLADSEDWQFDLMRNRWKDFHLTRKELEELGWFVEKIWVPNYVIMATLIDKWGKELKGKKGYSSVGAVIGATYPAEAKVLRRLMPNTLILVPGYGAQGGKGEDIPNFLNDDGYGAVINSSRGIIFAYQREPYKDMYGAKKFADAARQAALDMRKDITTAMKKAGKLPW